MTFAEIKRRAFRGILRDDLLSDMPAFVNEAVREIQDRRSWECMKDTADLTVPAGMDSVALPGTYKEAIKYHPVHLLSSDGGQIPVEVLDEESLRRRIWALSGLESGFLRVMLQKAPLRCLKLQGPADQDLTFRVKFFGYFPDLVADSDQNGLTVAYPRMVIALTKANAFAEVSDPASTDARAEYEVLYRQAAAQDAYSAVAGMQTRM